MYRVFSLKENKFVDVKESLNDEKYIYLPEDTANLLENEMFFDLWLFDYVRALKEYEETKSVESSKELDELSVSYPEFYKIYSNALLNYVRALTEYFKTKSIKSPYVRALDEYFRTKSIKSSEEFCELRINYPEFYKIYLNALFNERRFESEKS